MLSFQLFKATISSVTVTSASSIFHIASTCQHPVVFHSALKSSSASLLRLVKPLHSLAHRFSPQHFSSRQFQLSQCRALHHFVPTEHSFVVKSSRPVFFVAWRIVRAPTSSISLAAISSIACSEKCSGDPTKTQPSISAPTRPPVHNHKP